MLKSSPSWISLADLAGQLNEAGVGQDDWLLTIAVGAKDFGLIATGFRRIHKDGSIAEVNEREIVKGNLWRVIVRTDPTCSTVSEQNKAPFSAFARWHEGSITWTLERDEGGDMQETWASILFDARSSDAFLARIRSRESGSVLSVQETADWIRNDCTTENSKKGWQEYKGKFGNRAGKRDHVFMPAWRSVKGERKRGERHCR